MGKRIDTLLIINSIIFILEFKVGEEEFNSSAIDQVWDYALDLKNFHETSHNKFIVPILIATNSQNRSTFIPLNFSEDKVFEPIKCNIQLLQNVIENVILTNSVDTFDYKEWENGSYLPTPTIIEAATALYSGHSVEEISRNDAGAKNLKETSSAILKIIENSKKFHEKSICFVTGVPGAGKTLVGLNIATKNIDKDNDIYSVFLSGNGPLVSILREALARNKVSNSKNLEKKIKLNSARREVEMFIQNVHNFRDEGLIKPDNPPLEHVALFDEAQRAWNMEQTHNFMLRKKGIPNFYMSEPEFLISCMNRHNDWAVIVCLVGGGQEINTGEAGISEWIASINRSFMNWKIFISPKLTDSEYGAGQILDQIDKSIKVHLIEDLHLSTSMRSFRCEYVSLFVKQMLDLDEQNAKLTLKTVLRKYPIRITRDIDSAKKWLKLMARGSERYGLVVSSQALRLKPLAVDVRSTVDPIHWFLDYKDDVRSSYYLEDAATEFQIQGLELDWSCVVWDGDFRVGNNKWECYSFCGNKWNQIRKQEKQFYLKNAYRVLLTRARQGMIIVVPEGDANDPTRKPEYYDSVFNYLNELGIPII